MKLKAQSCVKEVEISNSLPFTKPVENLDGVYMK